MSGEILAEEDLDDAEALELAEESEDLEENVFGGKRFYRIYGMQRRMRELLALPAPDCDERDYLTDRGVPTECIDNNMLLMGMLFRLALDGNMRAFQELRHIAGDNETSLDRRIKQAQLRKTKEQIQDIKRKNAVNEEDCGGDSRALTEALNERTVSVWQNGGDECIDEQESE